MLNAMLQVLPSLSQQAKALRLCLSRDAMETIA
jgi:hypothetical protein